MAHYENWNKNNRPPPYFYELVNFHSEGLKVLWPRMWGTNTIWILIAKSTILKTPREREGGEKTWISASRTCLYKHVRHRNGERENWSPDQPLVIYTHCLGHTLTPYLVDSCTKGMSPGPTKNKTLLPWTNIKASLSHFGCYVLSYDHCLFCRDANRTTRCFQKISGKSGCLL